MTMQFCLLEKLFIQKMMQMVWEAPSAPFDKNSLDLYIYT